MNRPTPQENFIDRKVALASVLAEITHSVECAEDNGDLDRAIESLKEALRVRGAL